MINVAYDNMGQFIWGFFSDMKWFPYNKQTSSSCNDYVLYGRFKQKPKNFPY